jgi:hypothetical protein
MTMTVMAIRRALDSQISPPHLPDVSFILLICQAWRRLLIPLLVRLDDRKRAGLSVTNFEDCTP